jgi:hypothetical protein
MITMDEFSVYRFYLALKLHFTTDNYDVIKQKGKVRATKKSLYKRKDISFIKRIATTYNDEEVVNFLIANFVSGDRWGGLFDQQAKETYFLWKKRIESLTYTFTKEFNSIVDYAEDKNLDFFSLIFNSKDDSHPYIIRAYLGSNISIETLVILDKLYDLVNLYDKNIIDKIVWPDISRLIKKYKPFLKIDNEKYYAIIRQRIGLHTKQGI